jgi:uncharacterized protein (TIGR03545 family)
MMSWFRWTGIGAFTALLLAIVLFWLMAAGMLIKGAIEHYGSNALGAKVALDSVNLNLQPFGFTLHNFSAADPESPMTNALEFKKASAHVDLLKLMMGQVIIDDLEISGLEFNTARSSSGLIEKKTKERKAPKEKTEPGMFDSIQVKLPSADEILSREPLVTEQRKEEWDKLYASEKTKIEAMLAGLPDENKIKKYEQDIKQITQGEINSLADFNQSKERLDKIRAAIKQDRDNLRNAKKQYKESYAALKQQAELLKAAPAQDWNKIKNKYGLDEMGATNISRLLFGDSLTSIAQKALYWYQKAKPLLPTKSESELTEKKPERLKGRYVQFASKDPTPDFLIRKTSLDMKLEKGSFEGSLKDITHQQHVIKRPMLLLVKGEGLEKAASIRIDGTFDHIDPYKSVDKVTYTMQDVVLKNMKISKSHNLPLTLASAAVDIKGQVTLAGSELRGLANGDFQQARFESSAEEGFAKELGSALTKIDHFTLDTKFKGAMDDVDFDIKSDLDKRLKSAIKERFQEREQELEEKLKSRLDEKVAAYLGADNQQLAELLKGQGSVDNKLESIENLLQQKLDDYTDQKEKEAKDKLKEKEDELKDKLKKKWGL